jgi:hypothetical protein
LALVGAVALAIVLLRGASSPLAWWIANSALRPERILPLVGLGVALGLVRPLPCAAGVVAIIAGIGLGFAFYEPLLAPLWALPKPAESNFLTGPATALATGVALIAPRRMRGSILPPCALLAGMAAALAIVVTDPSIRDPSNRIAGVVIALWLIAAVALNVRDFRQPWFDIAGRILGSWLIAIALLYGGAALLSPASSLLTRSQKEMSFQRDFRRTAAVQEELKADPKRRPQRFRGLPSAAASSLYEASPRPT